MIVHRFLTWMQTAPAPARASATAALARAYLYSDMSPQERAEAERALTVVLDDPSTMVRQALAEALAHAADAAPHLIVALAADQSEVATIVLSRSTLLGEADLVDRVATGDALVQTAIAMRPEVPAPVAAAIAEVAEAEAVAALAANPAAVLPAFSLRRMVERFGADDTVREALLARPDLPDDVRLSVVTALADALGAAPGGPPDARQVQAAQDGAEKACLTLLLDADEDAFERMLDHLRRTGRLTPAFLLRSVLSGDTRLLERTLARLSGQKIARVQALIADAAGAGFTALCRKAGLPPTLVPAFEAALSARRLVMEDEYPPVGAGLCRRIAALTVEGCLRRGVAPDDRMILSLRKIETDAARDEARFVTAALLTVHQAHFQVPLLLGPEMQVDPAERISAMPGPALAIDRTADAA